MRFKCRAWARAFGYQPAPNCPTCFAQDVDRGSAGQEGEEHTDHGRRASRISPCSNLLAGKRSVRLIAAGVLLALAQVPALQQSRSMRA